MQEDVLYSGRNRGESSLCDTSCGGWDGTSDKDGETQCKPGCAGDVYRNSVRSSGRA